MPVETFGGLWDCAQQVTAGRTAMSRLDARFMTSAGYASRSAFWTTAEVPAAVLGSWLPSAACAGCFSPVRHARWTVRVEELNSPARQCSAEPSHADAGSGAGNRPHGRCGDRCHARQHCMYGKSLQLLLTTMGRTMA